MSAARRPLIGLPSQSPAAAIVATQRELVKATVTVPEAALTLGIGETLMWRLVKEGRLRSVKLGGRRLVPMSAIAALLDEPSAIAGD